MIDDYALKLIVLAVIRQAVRDAHGVKTMGMQPTREDRESAKKFLQTTAQEWLEVVEVNIELPEVA